MASETVDMTSEDVEMSSEDVETSSEDVDNSNSDRDLEGTRYRPRHLFRPFPTYVEEREIDLSALNNSDFFHYENRCKKPDMRVCTKIDDQVLLDLLTTRFNEWLKEARKKEKNGGSILAYSDVLEEMNCERVKFVGGLPEGYQYVSKPRELKRPFKPKKNVGESDEENDGENDGDEKPKNRKTTPDKYIYGHPHPKAEPFNSVSNFVLHAYWLIGLRNADTSDICTQLMFVGGLPRGYSFWEHMTTSRKVPPRPCVAIKETFGHPRIARLRSCPELFRHVLKIMDANELAIRNVISHDQPTNPTNNARLAVATNKAVVCNCP
ncbi:hypothetical protein KCU65_g7727, partial [Aureobasidium melanogenum]